MLKEMKETIRKFDEDICLKSNKVDLNLFKETVSSNYVLIEDL